jgi:NodT family efflux transporter outer membrane factor (OMF) lipoprotein
MTRMTPRSLCPPRAALLLVAALGLGSGACAVGPTYHRPEAPVPPAFKEAPPDGWKHAEPADGAIRGPWWSIYNDPALDELERRVDVSNQTVLAAEASYRAAADAVRAARGALFPSVTGGVSATAARPTTAGLSGASSAVRTTLQVPAVDLSYEADVWGSIRRTVRAATATAQASAAQLENARLIMQAELAIDYFAVHGLDGDIDLLERTVKSYEEYLALTRARMAAGVASGADVAQAEAQLNSARAQLTDLGVARAQYEHAVAILTGRPPSEVTLPRRTLSVDPPVVPVALPSTLLERRPDIAAAERQMAAQNEQIGIARAALFPTLGVSGSAGAAGTSLSNVFSVPALFWSLGVNAAEILFDAGRRRAITDEQRNLFDQTVANYRQTVLTGLQQVEDSLAALRILEREAAQVAQTVGAAQRSLDISTAQYKAGVVSSLQVITAQTTLLQSQRTAVDLVTRRLLASVQLVQALGGGWDASKLQGETGRSTKYEVRSTK